MIKTTISLAFAVMMIGSAIGQESLFQGCSSAGNGLGEPVYFNCDFLDPIGLPGVEVTLHHRAQSSDYFINRPMELISEPPYYVFTYEYEDYFDDDPGLLEYYFSAGTDTLVATQSPKNSNDQFPPPAYLYAPLAPDAEGDTTDGSAGGWLDLTGSGISYSDERIYGYLDNAVDTWPQSQGLEWYIYALGFVANLDSTLYAMVYGNIPFVLTPGLYKLNLIDTSFVRLGDVDNSVQAGRLHLACNIADFENDPDWPGWPPPNGFLATLGVTVTAGVFDQAINDFTYPSFFEPVTQWLDFNNNQPPTLVEYWFNIIPDISVTAHVKYHDADNNLPVTRTLFFNWGFYDMGAYDHIYADSSEFEVILGWPGPGWQYFHFEFSDGNETVVTQLDSIFTTPIGIEEDGNPIPEFLSLSQNCPNPFNSSTRIDFTIMRPSQVDIFIYDMLGRRIFVNSQAYSKGGPYSIIWDGRDSVGKEVVSGVYFYRISAEGNEISKRMVYLK